MSLVQEIGSAIKEQTDIRETDIASMKTEIETAVGTKLDNVTFKTLNGSDLTGTGDIDLTSILAGGGKLLASHQGAAASLNLSWASEAYKYATIKIFIMSPEQISRAMYMDLIDGRNLTCSYYCGMHHQTNANDGRYGERTACNRLITGCSSYGPCGQTSMELTIANDKSCDISSIRGEWHSRCANESTCGATGFFSSGAICTCCGINGICLTSDAGYLSNAAATVAVVGYDPH